MKVTEQVRDASALTLTALNRTIPDAIFGKAVSVGLSPSRATFYAHSAKCGSLQTCTTVKRKLEQTVRREYGR